jgi:hypothetical protein
MTRILLLTLSTIFLSPCLWAKTILITGFDDVIKSTHHESPLRGLIEALQTGVPVPGMPEALSALRRENQIEYFYIVSGSPTFLQPFIQAFNNKYDLQPTEVLLRKGPWQDVLTFKLQTIESVIRQFSPQDEFIVITDSPPPNPQLPQRLMALFPTTHFIFCLKPISKFVTCWDAIKSLLTSRLDLLAFNDAPYIDVYFGDHQPFFVG